MSPHDDFDAVLRAALDADADAGSAGADGAFGPPHVVRAAVVAGVRRRHRRRVESIGAVAAGVAVVAVLVSVLGGPSGQRPRVTEGIAAAPSSASTAPSSAGGAGCPEVRVGSGAASCTGSFGSGSGSGAGPIGFGAAADQSDAGIFGTATASPAPVRLRPGGRVTVTLAVSSAVAHWSRPTVSSGRQVLSTRGAAQHTGPDRTTVTFVAERPGTATVTAEATCARESQGRSTACNGSHERWTLVVEVKR